jgi:scyllo-inositol 2-dehydrogenase (NADP+)
VMLYEAHWDRFRPQIKQGWREQPDAGGGVLSDLGPHLIDQALQLFGMPEAVSADIVTQRAGAVVDDYFDLTLHYGRRRVRLCCSTLIGAPRPRFAIHGTQGSYIKHGVDPQEAQLKAGLDHDDESFGVDSRDGTFVGPTGEAESVPTNKGNYPAFYEAVADSILNGAPPPVPANEARDGLALINLARRAATLGSVLPVRDASSPEASVLAE